MKKLIGTYELDQIELSDGEPLRFRIEIFEDHFGCRCSARVLRWESVRLNVSFAEKEAVSSADYSVLVEDESLGIEEIFGDSLEKVLQDVLVRISETVGGQ